MTKSRVAVLVAAFTFTVANVPSVDAAKKKCPSGKYYDEYKRKCVTKRGS